jgi:hypothetical protein
VRDGGAADAEADAGAPLECAPTFALFRGLGASRITINGTGAVTTSFQILAAGNTALDVFVSGFPARLEGRPVELGVGDQASLATCSHCVVVRTNCPDFVCSGRTYFPISGRAILVAVPDGSGDGSVRVEFEDVVFGPVDLDPVTLETTPLEPLSTEDCFWIPRLVISDDPVPPPAFECNTAYLCEIARTAETRGD